jgi:integrase
MWRRYLKLAHGCTAAHKDGIVKYTAHELRRVCASLLIASGATDMQVTNQMGHSKIETTKLPPADSKPNGPRFLPWSLAGRGTIAVAWHA